MANLLEFWLNLLVTPAHLNTVQDNLQAADRAMLVDAAFGGVFYGLTVTERSGTPNLSVDVSAGAAYDVDGARCRTPSTQNVPVDEDSDGTPTAVAGVGNEKWVSVSIRFKRETSSPYVDGNSVPGNFVQDEGYEWVVKQGAEAGLGLAARPALVVDAVLLADVKLVHGQTQVVNANISTTRRQLPFDLAGSVHTLRAGRVGGSGGALEQLLGWLDGHISGSADKHAASAIGYGGGPTWADGTTNPATTAELQFDKIVSDLSTTNGAAKVRSSGWSIGVVTVTASNVYTQLQLLAAADNHSYLGGGTWADGATNPATSVEAQLDKIVSDLAATASSGGLAKVGCGARTAWLGGRANPATTSFAALNKIIVDLGLQDAGDDGMERVGGEARTGTLRSLAAGSAASQTTELLAYADADAAKIKNYGSKAWGRVVHTGGGVGSATIVDSENVASVTVNASTVVITFSTAFADTNFAPVLSPLEDFYRYIAEPGSFTTTSMAVSLRDAATNAVVNPSVSLLKFSFDIKGRQ